MAPKALRKRGTSSYSSDGQHKNHTMVSAKKRVELVSSALQEAVFYSRAEEVERLLADADFNKKPDQLIHSAAERGSRAIVQMLLDKGACVDAKTRNGNRPLLNAVWGGHGEVVTLLLDKCADVNATMLTNGETPLYYAIFTKRPAIVKQLLDHGAFVNQAVKKGYKEGFTPLHHAAASGHVEITQQLLDRGADLLARNKAGHTPEDVASSPSKVSMDPECLARLDEGKPEVAALLRSEVRRRAQCVAFAMSHHGRLGAGSLVKGLHPEVVKMILEYV